MRIEGPAPTNTAVGVGVMAASPMHIAAKPTHGAQFRISRRYVPTASQASGAFLWAMRNMMANTVVQLLQAKLSFVQVGAPTAAIEDRFSLTIARSYNNTENSGNISINPGGNHQKLRTSFPDSQVVVQETTAAGGLTGGIRTLDNNPIAKGSVWVLAAVPTAYVGIPQVIFNYAPTMDSGEHPLTMVQNEGWLLSCDNALGTASGIVLLLDLLWTETTVF